MMSNNSKSCCVLRMCVFPSIWISCKINDDIIYFVSPKKILLSQILCVYFLFTISVKRINYLPSTQHTASNVFKGLQYTVPVTLCLLTIFLIVLILGRFFVLTWAVFKNHFCSRLSFLSFNSEKHQPGPVHFFLSKFIRFKLKHIWFNFSEASKYQGSSLENRSKMHDMRVNVKLDIHMV